MSSNKLNKLIEKYNLINLIKVIALLLILLITYRIFIKSKNNFFSDFDLINSNSNSMSNTVIKKNIYEGFEQASLGNGNIYGNLLSLTDPTNIPIYLNNTCIFKLSNVYRIDTLIFNFNSPQIVNISFLDGNGNMKYIKGQSSTGSPPSFTLYPSNNPKSGPISSITDENDLVVYTSKIILTLVDNNNFKDSMINSFGIYGGDRNLPSLSDYNTISNSLNYSDTSFNLQPQTKPPDTNAASDTYVFLQSDDTMIYSLKIDIKFNNLIEKPILTESQFKLNIAYENSIYYQNVFNINTIYNVRNDYLSIDVNKLIIFLTEPIIANKIIFKISRISTITQPSQILSLKINTLKVLDKPPSPSQIADFKKTVNILNSSSTDDSGICPNINDLVDTQTRTQQICDTLEYQDKVKSEKLRLERNKQYLLKLKNQQQQIDQLNSVIEDLDSKRQARAQIADQARVLQYQNQKASASKVRDLANQRLESQENNQLYMDFKINTK
jgi:hypothetical protein